MAQAIRSIPAHEIEAANADGHPSVLVVGPNPFASKVFEYLDREFDNVEFKASTKISVSPIDGYLRLLKNRKSRLGWRILLYVHRPPGHLDAVTQALNTDVELFDLTPQGFRDSQLRVVEILGRIRDETATSEKLGEALAATWLSLDELLTELGFDAATPDEHPPEIEAEEDEFAEDAPPEPKIFVTTLTGSKGLQADHVFIVGVNAGHFPRNNAAPTEEEVCNW